MNQIIWSKKQLQDLEGLEKEIKEIKDYLKVVEEVNNRNLVGIEKLLDIEKGKTKIEKPKTKKGKKS